MAYTELLTAHGLTEEQWDREIAEEYLGENWWRHLTSSGENAVIQAKEDLTKKSGDAITIGLVSEIIGGIVTGRNKGKGNEGYQEYFDQRFVIDNVRVLVKFEDVPMTQKRVGFDVLQRGKDGLVRKARVRLEEEITNALSDTSTGRVRGRYLYGAADSNWNATHATALTAIDDTADQLSSAMVSKAKRKATIPTNAVAKIRPMTVKNGKNSEEWYILVAHDLAIRDLTDNDATFKNSKLTLTPGSDSPLLTGSRFKGSWNGVLIYEYDRILLASSTIQVAHNLLLGAQAGVVVWGQHSKFGEQTEDVGHDVIYETHEIRTVGKTVFNRTTPEDHGVVHVFSAAVAD
jgi:N4-gp56 family major capsid protein